MKKRIILSAVLTMLLCFCLIGGATFALFTSSSEVNIAVTSGKVKVDAQIDGLVLYSMDELQEGKFENGGTAVYENGTLTLRNVAPGDKVEFDIIVTNTSNIDIQYIVKWKVTGELAPVLESYIIEGVEQKNLENVSWTEWKAPTDEQTKTKAIKVAVELPIQANNDYQEKSANIQFLFEAVQANGVAYLPVEWDGTTDTDWYNDTDTEFTLNNPAQVAGLSDLVDAGNTFDGKTIKLESNLDFYCEDEEGKVICFDPIGSYKNDTAFKGTFDGQGYTVSNISQNTWALDNGYYYGDLGLGFFGLVEDATIKNLKVDKAEVSGESAICAAVAATAFGDCTFENITVSNSNVADYQYYAGAIVGWASGKHQYINCNVDASTNIAAQWGDFDNSIGGVIGGAGGSAEILLKDCTVACRIDAYNDVTSTYRWYAYRRAGMLIGNTGKTKVEGETTYADAPQLTCENVTVIYGEWANYTYCEFAGTSWPYVRVQAGVSNSAYSNPRYGHPNDANGNEVVDDNHVHNDGEDHQILCVFDQLYGGGQGVYGTSTHAGVTIVYNNK